MRPLWRIDFHTWLNHRLGIGTRTSVVVFHSREVLHPILEVHTQRRWDVSLKVISDDLILSSFGSISSFGLQVHIYSEGSGAHGTYGSFPEISKFVLFLPARVSWYSLFFCTWNENKPCSWLVLKKQTFVTYVIVFVICDVGLGFSSFRPWSMICLHLIFLWVLPIPGLW